MALPKDGAQLRLMLEYVVARWRREENYKVTINEARGYYMPTITREDYFKLVRFYVKENYVRSQIKGSKQPKV